jgi:hypothetical protein
MPTVQAIPLWQLLTVVAIPTMMVFAGILMNRQDFNRLDAKITGVDAKFDKRFDGLAGQLHSDMMMIHSIVRDFEGRISKLEPRR